MCVAIVTARGGSKRIPGKNIKLFSGKPMIAWPIIAAQHAGIFKRIVVSTDSSEIASVATEYGAEVPFMRPAELSDDYIGTAPVLLHALEQLQAEGAKIQYACCIYPTSPFLLPEDLKIGFEKLRNTDAPSIIPVTTFAAPILRAFAEGLDGTIDYNWPEYKSSRSQDLPEFYHDAGMFYWVDVARFCEKRFVLMPGTKSIRLPRKRVQDLDTLEDWENAELMAKALLLHP